MFWIRAHQLRTDETAKRYYGFSTSSGGSRAGDVCLTEIRLQSSIWSFVDWEPFSTHKLKVCECSEPSSSAPGAILGAEPSRRDRTPDECWCWAGSIVRIWYQLFPARVNYLKQTPKVAKPRQSQVGWNYPEAYLVKIRTEQQNPCV